MPELCCICGRTTTERDRVVLVRGRARAVHCSESCLQDTFRKGRIARAKARRRWAVCALVALIPAGSNFLWQRYRAPLPKAIVSESPEPLPASAPPEPIRFGPAWPPTDADWFFAFAATHWVYPLPGPYRRPPTNDARILGPESPKGHPASCRTKDHCGVDLGGELWGEHVYAVHDGVVDHVQSGGNEERGGIYVRLAHFGGMVFTQYFHLAAVPRGIGRGVRIKAGDIIGSLGDTGLAPRGAHRHLHFALSIRPSSEFAEVYWDPKPWMEGWPLRLPAHGTVAGLAPSERPGETPPRRRRSK